MLICDLESLMCSNADGRSEFKMSSSSQRYRIGEVSHPDVYFRRFGVVDSETMTMPVWANDQMEYDHINGQLEDIAAAILNDMVEVPHTEVAPHRFRAHVFDYRKDGSLGAVTDDRPPRVPRDMIPIHQLFYAPLGLKEAPYTDGLSALAKIASVLCATGYDYSINTRRQVDRRFTVADLPGWVKE